MRHLSQSSHRVAGLLALLLGAVPPLLVILDRWFGIRVAGGLQQLWCRAPVLCASAWPSYFIIIFACTLCVFIITLYAGGEASNDTPTSKTGNVRPPLSRTQQWMGIGLVLAGVAGCVATLVPALRSGQVVGGEYAAWLGLCILGWPVLSVSTAEVRAYVELHWLPAFAGFLGLVALYYVLFAFYRGNGIAPLTLIVLGAAAAMLYAARQRLSGGYWLLVLASVLFTLQLNAWYFAFVGDEYAFYGWARRIALASGLQELRQLVFNGAVIYEQHPFVSSVLQAITVRLFDDLNFGWRTSSIAASAVSVLLFYYFFRAFLPRWVAFAGAFFIAVSHFLMSFSRIGYNSTQALLAMSLALAVATWAIRSGRHLAFALTGTALAACFYVFPTALYVPPLVLCLLVCYYPPTTRGRAARWGVLALSALLPIAPLLDQPLYWAARLNGTLLAAGAPVLSPLALLQRVLSQLGYAFYYYAFIPQETHFVTTAAVDGITAALLLVGTGVLLSRVRRNQFAFFALSGMLLLLVLVGATHQYPAPSNTRMFMLIPWYALFAAVGLHWLAGKMGLLSRSRMFARAALAGVLLVVLGLNLYQAYGVGVIRSEQRSQSFEALFVRLAGNLARRPETLPQTIRLAYEPSSEDPEILQQIVRLAYLPIVIDAAPIGLDRPAVMPASGLADSPLIVIAPRVADASRASYEAALLQLKYAKCQVTSLHGQRSISVWYLDSLPSPCVGEASGTRFPVLPILEGGALVLILWLILLARHRLAELAVRVGQRAPRSGRTLRQPRDRGGAPWPRRAAGLTGMEAGLAPLLAMAVDAEQPSAEFPDATCPMTISESGGKNQTISQSTPGTRAKPNREGTNMSQPEPAPASSNTTTEPARRRAVKRWSLPLAVVAIAAAVAGQMMLLRNAPSLGWPLFGVAAILFIAALGGVDIGKFAAADSDSAVQHRGPSGRFARGCLVVAVVASVACVVLFGREATAPLAWMFYLLSLVLLIVAFMPWPRLGHLRAFDASGLLKALVGALPLLLVLALATFARLWQLRQFPFGSWTDEATAGLAALRIMENPAFRPVYFDETKHPALFNYLLTPSFAIFGADPLAIRIVTAVFGIGSVLFAFLLFRRWMGPKMGLMAAGILAVLRYSLTFSRFGMQGISVPLFELMALFFLDRALARRRPADFAWLGLSIGLGLQLYLAYRLFPVALAIILLALFAGAARRSGFRTALDSYIRQLWPQWLIALLCLAITIAPVAEYAVRKPGQFFGRTSTVSIFTQRDEPNLGKALVSNTLKHLEMFNYQGDRNGRHNLPGAPMLDPVMGVLFVLGLAFALRRWKQPQHLVMLVLFAVMLLGGILSLDFEAPQSLRSIGVIPALVYFITLPVALMEKAVRPLLHRKAPASLLWTGRRSGDLREPVIAGAGILLLGSMAFLNFRTFFVDQQGDPGAWASYSTAETIAADEMRLHNGSYDFLVTGLFDQSPTVRFVARGVTNIHRWTSSDRLPVSWGDPDRGLIMLFDGMMLPSYIEARQVYPHADFREWHAPSLPDGSGTILYEVVVPADQLREMHGVEVQYFSGTVASGAAEAQEFRPQVSVDWTEQPPVPMPFVARLRTTLHVDEYGKYGFKVEGAPGAALLIDESPVDSAPVTLARGNHSLRLETEGAATSVRLLWQPPGSLQFQPVPAASLFRPYGAIQGLLGAYYPNADWSGEPAFEQVDPAIAAYFHIPPLPQPFSVEWTGKLFAPSNGTYDLALQSANASWLMIDGRTMLENPGENAKINVAMELARGWHDIKIRFQDLPGPTRIYLFWTPPGSTTSEWIPSRFLSPPMGQLPPEP